MLKLAYPYKEQLQEKYNQVIYDEKYKFYNISSYWTYEFIMDKNGWDRLDFVSVDADGFIIGYLGAALARPMNFVDGLSILNFGEKGNYCFAKDLHTFLIDLFLKFNFYKISFSIVVGNSIEKMYDKYVLKHGGRIIGHNKKHAMLYDGQLYDVKYYELFKDDFQKHRNCRS